MHSPADTAPDSFRVIEAHNADRGVVYGSVLLSVLGQDFDALDLTGLFDSEVEEVKRWIEFHKSDEQRFRYKTYLSKI